MESQRYTVNMFWIKINFHVPLFGVVFPLGLCLHVHKLQKMPCDLIQTRSCRRNTFNHIIDAQRPDQLISNERVTSRSNSERVTICVFLCCFFSNNFERCVWYTHRMVDYRADKAEPLIKSNNAGSHARHCGIRWTSQ